MEKTEDEARDPMKASLSLTRYVDGVLVEEISAEATADSHTGEVSLKLVIHSTVKQGRDGFLTLAHGAVDKLLQPAMRDGDGKVRGITKPTDNERDPR